MGTTTLRPSARESLRNSAPTRGAARFFGYVVIVVVLAAVLLSVPWIRITAGEPALGLAFWLMAALALVADAWPFNPPMRRMSSAVFPSICFTFAILLMAGLAAAVAVQAAAVIVSSWRMK